MRLDKFLSNMGLGTRKEIKKEITKGHVTINDEICRKVGELIWPEKDSVTLNGAIVRYQSNVYLMMHKPAGVISATTDSKHDTVIDLVAEVYGNRKLFPVGRLDIDTEGLLLITDDGDFNHALMAPNKHVDKTYYAKIQGTVLKEYENTFSDGIVLEDGYKCKPGFLEILNSDDTISEVQLTIQEGKYHQVKRMFEALNMKVVYLKRIRIGNLNLDSTLMLGEFRELTEDEIILLKP